MYTEVVFRTPPSSWQNFGADSIALDWWHDTCNGCSHFSYPQGGAEPEVDFFEIHPNSYDGSTFEYDGAVTFRADPTQYHTYGSLTTGDGTTFAECMYVDGVRQNDKSGSSCYTRSQNSYVLGHDVSWWIGGDDCFGNPGCMGNNFDFYLQSVRIWMCPGAWTSTCTGTVITSQKGTTPWYKRFASFLSTLFVSPATAEPFDAPYLGYWKCSNGKFGLTVECIPPEFRGVEWWKACIPGRSDCVHSDTAYIGFDPKWGRALRGSGFCYTGQPYTCAPNGKWSAR